MRSKSQRHAPAEGRAEEITLARLGRGLAGELRVSLCEFQGAKFLWLQVWAPGPDGRPRPVKGRGCSVRIHEIPRITAALEEARELIDAESRPASSPARPAAGALFSEFDEDT